MDWFDGILYPIMWVVAAIMVGAHNGLTAIGMESDGGWTWLLSIVALVVVIRVLLIPLFVRQIKASRGMQLVQPEIQKLQKKYKGKTDPASRQAMQQQMMAIYRENGTSPFASCLPLLAQMPIFFALFRVLDSLDNLAAGNYGRDSIGMLTQDVAQQAEQSTIFGAQLSSTFLTSDLLAVKIICGVLVVIMSATTLFTQRQLTMKNMPQAALDNPLARQQRILMYILPAVFLFSGVNFPIGVLIYWTTSNIWSMGQQWWVIRNNPTPGSEAARAFEARKARRAARKAQRSGPAVATIEDEPVDTLEDAPQPTQRVQPKKGGSRSQRKGSRPRQQPAGGALQDVPAQSTPIEDEPATSTSTPIEGEPATSTPTTSKKSGARSGSTRKTKK